MKKWITLLLCLSIVLAMSGCVSNNSAGKPGRNPPAGVSDVLEKGMADSKKADNTALPGDNGSQSLQNAEDHGTDAPESTEPDPDPAPADAADVIDVDLTLLSATMVYSEVYDMMTSPEKYIGKTVKMKGPFAFYHDEATGNYYFACIIQDATACCAQGIEFVLTDDYVYPDDYPEINEEICVVGVFDTYQEGEYTYCTLRKAKLL